MEMIIIIIILKMYEYFDFIGLPSIAIKNEEATQLIQFNESKVNWRSILSSIACSIAIIHFVFRFRLLFRFCISTGPKMMMMGLIVAHSFYWIDHLFSNCRINNTFSNFCFSFLCHSFHPFSHSSKFFIVSTKFIVISFHCRILSS